MLSPQASAMHRPPSFRGVAGAGLEISGTSVFLRVSLSGLTGFGSLCQVEGSSELPSSALEQWTHGVILKLNPLFGCMSVKSTSKSSKGVGFCCQTRFREHMGCIFRDPSCFPVV